MGQKVNPLIFRSNKQQNTSKFSYYVKTVEENSNHIFENLQLIELIKLFFNKYNIKIGDYKILKTESSIIINISLFISKQTTSIFKKNTLIKLYKKRLHKKKFTNFKYLISKIKKNKNFKKIKLIKKFLKKQKRFLIRFKNTLKKKKIFKIINKINNNKLKILYGNNLERNNINTILNNLTIILNKYYKFKKVIFLNLQHLNKGNSLRLKSDKSLLFRKLINSLKRYKNQNFFKFEEAINIIYICLTKKNTGSILSNYLKTVIKTLKRPKFFINFLEKTLNIIFSYKLSYAKGIKIIIKGRLSKSRRSKQVTIKVGSIPLQTFKNTTLNYSTSTVINKNGSLGIKVWIN